MKALWYICAIIGAFLLLKFVFHLISFRAIIVGLIMYVVGYAVGSSHKDTS